MESRSRSRHNAKARAPPARQRAKAPRGEYTTGPLASETAPAPTPDFSAGSDPEALRELHQTIAALDDLYRVLLQEAARVRSSDRVGLGPLRELLNQTRPHSEPTRQLSLIVELLAGIHRGSFISYAFKIKRACLLLLLGPRGALTALNLETVLDAWLADGSYGLSRLSAGAASAPPPAGLAPAGPSRLRPDRGSPPDRARPGSGRGRQAATKQTMSAEEYSQLLARIDAPLGAGDPEPEGFPALSHSGPGAAKATSPRSDGGPHSSKSWYDIVTGAAAPADQSSEPDPYDECADDAPEGPGELAGAGAGAGAGCETSSVCPSESPSTGAADTTLALRMSSADAPHLSNDADASLRSNDADAPLRSNGACTPPLSIGAGAPLSGDVDTVESGSGHDDGPAGEKE